MIKFARSLGKSTWIIWQVPAQIGGKIKRQEQHVFEGSSSKEDFSECYQKIKLEIQQKLLCLWYPVALAYRKPSVDEI